MTTRRTVETSWTNINPKILVNIYGRLGIDPWEDKKSGWFKTSIEIPSESLKKATNGKLTMAFYNVFFTEAMWVEYVANLKMRKGDLVSLHGVLQVDYAEPMPLKNMKINIFCDGVFTHSALNREESNESDVSDSHASSN